MLGNRILHNPVQMFTHRSQKYTARQLKFSFWVMHTQMEGACIFAGTWGAFPRLLFFEVHVWPSAPKIRAQGVRSTGQMPPPPSPFVKPLSTILWDPGLFPPSTLRVGVHLTCKPVASLVGCLLWVCKGVWGKGCGSLCVECSEMLASLGSPIWDPLWSQSVYTVG